ncbi:MAG: translation initiation factor IF-2 [Desulfovibrionaceae bacterium]|nr:translation initiation factor IF-2 [Desulfovibrionaceae bacterium]
MDNFTDFTRRASVPEQLEHYVRSVGSCTPMRLDSALGWRSGSSLVLVVFPPDMDTPDEAYRGVVDGAVAKALALDWLQRLTVLSPFRPSAAPENAHCREDACWTVDLPVIPPKGKLANMLRRAAGCVDITIGDAWTQEHEDLVALASANLAGREGERRLSEESGLLFGRVGRYVRNGEGRACCYSARRRDTGTLCGLVVADHAAYMTSFYLFAFRAPDAPPGTADALLHALLEHSRALGQQRCNLGLGIHPGIHFFKRKWGARPFLPFVECSWDKPSHSLFSRLSGLFGRRS